MATSLLISWYSVQNIRMVPFLGIKHYFFNTCQEKGHLHGHSDAIGTYTSQYIQKTQDIWSSLLKMCMGYKYTISVSIESALKSFGAFGE